MERQSKVLVVDDDQFALRSMARALAGESYQVVTAAGGSEAIDLLRQDSFDVVLTDLKMPGVDGLEVLRQAREIVPQAVVLVLTGYASLESAIEALRKGAYDYLVKPCSDDELKLKIAKGLERVCLAEERQHAEEMLRRAHDELEERVQERTAELAKANEALQAEITARKQVDGEFKELLKKIERAKQEWESTADSLPDLVCLVDHRGRIMRANRTVETWNLARVVDVKGRGVHELLHPGCTGSSCYLNSFWKGAWEESLRGQPAQCEAYDQFLNRHVLVQVQPWKDWGKGTALGSTVVVVRDITERVQAEEALHQYAERLRALATQMAEVEEAERQRLARELHDQVGQSLTALGINLNIVRTQMLKEATDVVRSRLDDSLALVEQTTERIRDVMADLRPPVLDDYGLMAALRWYGEQFASRTGITVDVHGEELDPRLPADVETVLFRIAQEAVTNVTKHAQATQVLMAVEVDDETVRLVVADDGVGFDPARLSEPGERQGWGLLNMTERAEAAGGRCHIESGPAQGTKITVEVPR
jgi:signal transduction histidine kinase